MATEKDISPKGWRAYCLFSLHSKIKAIQAINTLFLLVSKNDNKFRRFVATD
jgi:hypothetical protein